MKISLVFSPILNHFKRVENVFLKFYRYLLTMKLCYCGIEHILERDGFMSTIQLTVEGMSCGNCVKSIETNLQALNGVSSASVSLETKQVTVEADEHLKQQIVETIESLGFDVV